MGVLKNFLYRIVLKPKIKIADSNISPNWIETEEWRSWEAPLDLVRGESYRQKNLRTFAGKPRENGYLIPKAVTLVREPNNKYDPNAIRVEVEGLHVGYIAKEFAAKLAFVMDLLNVTSFQVAGVIRGGSFAAPTLGVHIWLNKRITKGPVIEITNALRQSYQVPWPPSDKEINKPPQIASFVTLDFPPRSKTEKPGYYQGKYYTEYVDLVKQLKRAGEYEKAEKLLIALIEAVESESIEKDWAVAPWYYEQLAIIYRRQKNLTKELEILERFSKQKIGPGATPPQFFKRLETVRKKLEQMRAE
ncbi:HIRAN domain-containing protein [Thermovorax subterraneus]|nr:HIRAN domain-containing protein [Thermovorax subterraneus]